MTEKVVVLTQAEFKNIPGYSTTKSASHFRGLIIGQLEEMGATGYGFDEGDVVWKMKFDVADGTKRVISFRIHPSIITVSTKRRGHATENVRKENVTWKVIYELIRYKVAAIKVGVLSAQNEFMPNISMLNNEGQETTLGQMVEVLVEQDRLNNIVQLEDKRRE